MILIQILTGHQVIASAILPYLKTSSTQINNIDSDDKEDNNKQDNDKQENNNQENNKQENNNQENDNQENEVPDSDVKEYESSPSKSKTNDTANTKKDSSSTNDSTVADGKLPQTGIECFSLSIILLFTIIGFYSFIKYKKNKDFE